LLVVSDGVEADTEGIAGPPKGPANFVQCRSSWG